MSLWCEATRRGTLGVLLAELDVCLDLPQLVGHVLERAQGPVDKGSGEMELFVVTSRKETKKNTRILNRGVSVDGVMLPSHRKGSETGAAPAGGLRGKTLRIEQSPGLEEGDATRVEDGEKVLELRLAEGRVGDTPPHGDHWGERSNPLSLWFQRPSGHGSVATNAGDGAGKKNPGP